MDAGPAGNDNKTAVHFYLMSGRLLTGDTGQSG